MHNEVVLAVGYYFSRIMKVSKQDPRSIFNETGIQNSGYGLLIVFSVFDRHWGMALIRAWCSIWHIISGFTVAELFLYRDTTAAKAAAELAK